jgi:hypothetical protein
MLGWLSTTEHYSMTLVAVYTADLDAKKAKVERYFQRSRDNGTLQEG